MHLIATARTTTLLVRLMKAGDFVQGRAGRNVLNGRTRNRDKVTATDRNHREGNHRGGGSPHIAHFTAVCSFATPRQGHVLKRRERGWPLRGHCRVSSGGVVGRRGGAEWWRQRDRRRCGVTRLVAKFRDQTADILTESFGRCCGCERRGRRVGPCRGTTRRSPASSATRSTPPPLAAADVVVDHRRPRL